MNLWKSAAAAMQTALKTKPRRHAGVCPDRDAHSRRSWSRPNRCWRRGSRRPPLGWARKSCASQRWQCRVRPNYGAGSFARGQTALVSAGTRGTSPPLVETTVIGNRGAISWEPAACEALTAKEPDAALTGDGRRLLGAVRKSLELRAAINLDDGKAAPTRSREDRAVRRPSARRCALAEEDRPPFGVLLIAGNHTHQENYARSLAADKRCRLIAVSDDPDLKDLRREWNEALARELKIPYLPNYRHALARRRHPRRQRLRRAGAPGRDHHPLRRGRQAPLPG